MDPNVQVPFVIMPIQESAFKRVNVLTLQQKLKDNVTEMHHSWFIYFNIKYLLLKQLMHLKQI